jgi:PAS domain S-box-containing protein
VSIAGKAEAVNCALGALNSRNGDGGNARIVTNMTRATAHSHGGVVHGMEEAALSACPFRIAFMASPLAKAITNPQGVFMEVNERFCTLLGYCADEIVGRRFTDFTHPEDILSGLDAMHAVLEGKCEVVRLEKRYLRGDGTIIWARVNSVLQRDEAGRPLQFIAQIEDLHESRRAEAALRQQAAQYRTLVEHAPEAILVLDVDLGRFVDANLNAERLFRMSREEILRAGPSDLGPPVQPDGTSTLSLQSARVAAALDGKIETFERTLRDSTGREFYCEIRLVRLPSERERLIRASIIEITTRKEAEARQQRLIRELNHRVKNTLASILTLSRQSILRARSLEEFDEGFFGRLMAMSRAHEALTAAQWEQIELDALAHLVLGPHLISRDPYLSLGCEHILLPARAVVPLAMALHELATNALKHGALSRPGGRAVVRWRLDGRWIELTWTETGGTAPQANIREGTGIELIRGFIAFELGGKVQFETAAGSFKATLRMPLDR